MTQPRLDRIKALTPQPAIRMYKLESPKGIETWKWLCVTPAFQASTSTPASGEGRPRDEVVTIAA